MQRFPYERTVLLTLGAGLARPDALLVALQVLRDFPVNAVVETGTRLEVAQLGRQPVQIAAAQRLPLAKVLPLCTAVISPGSAEEVLGALAYGLPQVCLPRTLDQRHNAAAVTATGAAIGVAPDPLLPGALRRALADVLAAPSYARAARNTRPASPPCRPRTTSSATSPRPSRPDPTPKESLIMKFLFTSNPLYGHFMPMVPLIRAAGRPVTRFGWPPART